MALVTEDGTARADAEAYISVADADTYHTSRGNTAWTGTDTAKEGFLRKATDYMLQTYRERWKGWRVATSQSLDWPRYGVQLTDTYSGAIGFYQLASNAVPIEVTRACAELALRVASGEELLADIQPAIIAEKVGPIEVTYASRSTAIVPPRIVQYPAIDRMLTPYLDDAGGVPIKRA